MAPPGPPVLLLEPGTAAGLDVPVGWACRRDLEPGGAPWDLTAPPTLCIGIVDDATLGPALELVQRGAALAVEVALRGAARHRFLEDLHKLGARVTTDPADLHLGPALPPLQQQLLDALADGATVTAAAEAAHVSRRTANRALAAARSQLGVATNAAAIRRWRTARTP